MIHEKTFPVCGRMDVTDNDLLLVRTKEETKCWIQVMNRLTGDLINKIPSMCDHTGVHVRRYPKNQEYVFESCSTCEEIYAHNINTRENSSVHKGSKIHRMCDGPGGSLLVMNTDSELHRLRWDKAQRKAQIAFVQNIPRPGKRPLRLCYVECHDILMCTMKDWEEDQGYEIIAVKLGSETFVWSGGCLVQLTVSSLRSNTIMWRLYGPVDGHVIKPESITCDSDGNGYISDQGNNRILKVNSLTGEILGILLLEEKEIWSMRWSNREPNLTLWEYNQISDQISTYFVPE